MVEIGDIFYYGITLDESELYNLSSIDKIQYIKTFLKSHITKFVEYKVKLTQIEYNTKNNQLVWKLEILEILNQEKCVYNQVGTIVFAYDNNKYVDLRNNLISIKPRCEINDGGCLNCSGCYKSLVIPWQQYLNNVKFVKSEGSESEEETLFTDTHDEWISCVSTDLSPLEFIREVKRQLDNLHEELDSTDSSGQRELKNNFMSDLSGILDEYLEKNK